MFTDNQPRGSSTRDISKSTLDKFMEPPYTDYNGTCNKLV